MVDEIDVELLDGRTLHVHDTGPGSGQRMTLVWHTGSPQSGVLLAPVVEAAEARGVRVVSYGRPGYGSTRQPGRDAASAAHDTLAIVDHLGIERFATMGASGGGPPALACAALLPNRVLSAVTFAGLAPYDEEPDWYAGMQAPQGLKATSGGLAARERFAETDDFDPESFIEADYELLGGDWKSLGEDAGSAGEKWPMGLVDDDMSGTKPWGFDLGDIRVPVLVVQGGLDRVVPPSHAARILRSVPGSQAWQRPLDGHISVLAGVPVALDWMLDLL